MYNEELFKRVELLEIKLEKLIRNKIICTECKGKGSTFKEKFGCHVLCYKCNGEKEIDNFKISPNFDFDINLLTNS